MGTGFAISCDGCSLRASALSGSGFDMRVSNIVVACDGCKTVGSIQVRTGVHSEFYVVPEADPDDELDLAGLPFHGEPLICGECGGVLRTVRPVEIDIHWEPDLPVLPDLPGISVTRVGDSRCPACGGTLKAVANLFFD